MSDRNAEHLAKLGTRGRTWESINKAISFQRPAPLFDQPMEITRDMMYGLFMVDTTPPHFASQSFPLQHMEVER